MKNNYLDLTKVKDINDLNEKEKIVAFVTFFRLDLYNNGYLHGSKAIQEKLRENDIYPLPSISTISKILTEQYLTDRRTGYYEEDYNYINRRKNHVLD